MKNFSFEGGNEEFDTIDFGVFPHLENYQELIGTEYEIVGYGSLAVVIRSDENGLVYKIPYESCFDSLLLEAKHHEAFYLRLRSLKDVQKVPEFIKVPRIRHKLSEKSGLYSQEMIKGLTLKSIDIILETKDFNEDKKKELLESYTDFKLKRIFVETMGMDREDFDFTWNCKAQVALEGLERKGFTTKFKVQSFLKALDLLEESGCKHPDLHNSNVMIDRQGNIYIIDFGPTKN